MDDDDDEAAIFVLIKDIPRLHLGCEAGDGVEVGLIVGRR